MGQGFRSFCQRFAVGLLAAVLGAASAFAGTLELLFQDGFQSGAACAWSSYVSPTLPGGCVIDGTCYAPGATDPGNQGCGECDPAQSETDWTVVNEGGACTDDDACTLADTCSNGVCVSGEPDSCDDFVLCTDDSCDSPTGCLNVPNDTVCDDLLACTINSCDERDGCLTQVVAGSCAIDFVCYDDEEPSPANACLACDADQNQEVFTPRPPGFECEPGVCTSEAGIQFPDQCDANATCVDGGTGSCAPFDCSSGACLTTCASSSQCSSGNYCSAPQCLPKKANGQACSAADNCISNFCVDGFCCESNCGGTCESCNQPGRLGFCDAVPSGFDPANECTQDPASTCDRDGFCDGARACRLWASGTACSAAACVGSPFPQQSNPPDLCDGSGTCNVTPAADCGNYLCNSATGLCRTSCTEIFHCDAGFNCTGSTGNPGVCV